MYNGNDITDKFTIIIVFRAGMMLVSMALVKSQLQTLIN